MRVWCRLWCWQLCAFWWKSFLAILGNATAAQEAADGRIGFSLFQGLYADEMHGRSQIHDRDELADQSPPWTLCLQSALYEKNMILWWTTVQNYQKPPTVNTVKICLTAWQIQTGNGWKQYLVCPPDKWWKGDMHEKSWDNNPIGLFIAEGGWFHSVSLSLKPLAALWNQ